MKKRKVIIILGPTGIGKTSVAFELARTVAGGEVINMDKVFIFKRFPISSGLADTLKEKGVKRHLYMLLEPNQDIIPPADYALLVKKEAEKITASDGVAIIEGGSTTYGPAVLDYNRNHKFCSVIVGLRFAKSVNIREKMLKRVSLAIEEGLVDEIKSNLGKYRNTMIMQEAHFVVPIVSYLDGKISLEEAKAKIVERCIDYINHQMRTFEKYPEIVWIDYDSSLFKKTISKIMLNVSDKNRK